jgi:SagB-type dehydrogenase family enzyme
MSDKLEESLVADYFRNTSLSRKSIKSISKPQYHSEAPYKIYPESEKILLPRAGWELSEARIIPLLQKRRSIRKFSKSKVSLSDMAVMLWGSQGVTAQAGSHLFRTTPSAGALYPVETYIVVQNVEKLKKGIYHFDVRSFQLELIDEGDYSRQVAAAFLDQEFMTRAAVNVIWTAIAGRNMSKYGDRGGRYLLLDVAHICQNLIMAAEAVNCGSCPVAAFYDDEVTNLLDIDGINELPLYGASIGKK